MPDITTALGRLQSLYHSHVLADAEYEVARDAMLGVTETARNGRSIRAEAYRVLSPAAGGSFIVMDVLRKARLGRYDWTRLALELNSDQLERHLLGHPYESAVERWNDFFDKLERLEQVRTEEHLSREQFWGVKYPLLGRLDWLGLVGELLWLSCEWGGMTLWRREDGWITTDEEVNETISALMRRIPHEESPVRDERIHHYYDWINEQCWRDFNDYIAERDDARLVNPILRRPVEQEWTFW